MSQLSKLTGTILLLLCCLSSRAQQTGNATLPLSIQFSSIKKTFTLNGYGNDLAGKMTGSASRFSDHVMEDALRFPKPGAGLIINNATLNLSKVFTISCWVKVAPDRQQDRVILSKGAIGDAGFFVLKLARTSGRLQFWSPALKGDCNSEIILDDNRWHHISVTYKEGRMKFYKNGSLAKTSQVTGSIRERGTDLSIGSLTNSGHSFRGAIAGVKIYSAVLSSIKIAALSNRAQGVWNLNEGMGISTFEQVGNPEYGMLAGAANTYNNYGVAHTGWLKETFWITDTKFSHILDFNSNNSGVYIDSADQVQLKNRFTIACWVRAHPGKNSHRVILSKGADTSARSYFEIYLHAQTSSVIFFAPALSGNLNSSITVKNSRWHHIALTYAAGKLIFYKDGRAVKTISASGAIAATPSSMTIGNRGGGGYPFKGNISHLQVHGSAFTAEQVKDLYNVMPAAHWKMDAVKESIAAESGGEYNGMAKNIVQVPGNGSSFSFVLNFSEPGSGITVPASSLNLADKFSIGAWIKRSGDRFKETTIVSKGYKGAPGSFQLKFAAGTGKLVFIAPALSGDMQSGLQVNDSNWHHILVTYGNGYMQFYKDRQLVKTAAVRGSIPSVKSTLGIGCITGSNTPFSGNIAEVKIYRSVRSPEEVTSIVPPSGPALILKKGIVFDRIQNQGLPVKPEWEISENDIAVAKAIGFDHIKLLLTADEFIQDGGLNQANMYFVDQTVNRILASGLPCVIDLHPEGKFKARYVGTDTGRIQMFSFYKAFSAYLAARWNPQQIAFQLMTEPFGNKPGDWNRINDEMVKAVRSEMPHHTLIVSGDRAGNIYAMTSMVPLDDPNIYYSFTTYEPYRFGFNTQFGAWRGAGGYWKDISYMPWPATPEIVQNRMDSMLATVAENDRGKAKKDLLEYGNGYFNSQWLNLRAKNVKEWNDAYGGDLQVIVAEFGAIDHKQATKNGKSKGIYPAERTRFVEDMRRSFESVGMGWEYWSFNEYFTILGPEVRKPYGPASKTTVDSAMVKALGLIY